MIKAEVLADSDNQRGDRITTMKITFPRIILAEFNTHRMFSRNSASSRAIPFTKMMDSVLINPFIPIVFGRTHKGMQASEWITKDDKEEFERAERHWLQARSNAVQEAEILYRNGISKQICNRLLEPFMWHTVIVTATEWENFFELRCPQYSFRKVDMDDLYFFRSRKDLIKAEYEDLKGIPYAVEICSKKFLDKDWLHINKGQSEFHMMTLAETMWNAYNESIPKKLEDGEWHIPYEDKIIQEEIDKLDQAIPIDKNLSPDEDTTDLYIKIATAMCARVSYTVVGEEGKENNYENDLKLHDNLAKSGHWSPFEHCARAMSSEEYFRFINTEKKGCSGNFKGFIQYRKMFSNENVTK